ncbi:MAG: RpiB/LacA/LacB family sugar-phosphate isomerase [Nanoarchaeota archaeon]|mgnify:CR=1 FL=1
MKSVFLGADHAGFKIKEAVKKYLEGKNFVVHDLGAKKLDENDDYPDFAFSVAEAVSESKDGMGILFCGSGQGMCVTANKVKGIRAVVASTPKDTLLSRQHLNSNVLCLSGWNTNYKKAIQLVSLWLKTPFSEAARHNRRLKKIAKLER